MRPPSVYAKPSCPASDSCDVLRLLHGPHRTGCRLVMILLSQQGFSAAQIADLLGYDPSTVRRWIHRYQRHGTTALADRPRSGRPRLGSPRLHQRIRRLLAAPKAWTIGRLYQRLGRPAISMRTLHRRVREVAAWRRPRLVAKGDPDRDQILADLRQHIRNLPTGAVLLAEDETHVNLLAWVRATWIVRGTRQQVMTPGKNRRRTIFGAVDLQSGRFHYQVTRKAVSCWPPTRPHPWWRWFATTSSSTAPRSSSDGARPIPACGCCMGRATAPTTTRLSGSGGHSRRGWPTTRP
jgi:transposase